MLNVRYKLDGSDSRTKQCTVVSGVLCSLHSVKCQTAPRLTSPIIIIGKKWSFQGPHSTNSWRLWYQSSLLCRGGPGSHPRHLLLQPAGVSAGWEDRGGCEQQEQSQTGSHWTVAGRAAGAAATLQSSCEEFQCSLGLLARKVQLKCPDN